MDGMIYIGEDWWHDLVGLRYEDLVRHIYIVGKSGTGKSTLQHNIAVQLILGGQGFCFIDPLGKTVENLIDHIPLSRADDFIYLNPGDLAHPFSYNPLERVPLDDRPGVADDLIAFWRSFWGDSWGTRMERLWLYSVRALLDYQTATLLWIPRMLTEQRFLDRVLRRVVDDEIWRFWEYEWPGYERSWLDPVLNKASRFMDAPVMRNVLGQVKSSINFELIMDRQKMVLVNLDKGRLGKDRANLIGSLIVNRIYQTALKRRERRAYLPNFTAIVDEFHNLTSDSTAEALSDVRDYGLGLVLAHQHVGQIKRDMPRVFEATTGNVGSLIVFNVGAKDAEELAKEYTDIKPEELVGQRVGMATVKLLEGGRVGEGVKVWMLPYLNNFCGGRRKLIEGSQRHFTQDRAIVEDMINRWMRGRDVGGSNT